MFRYQAQIEFNVNSSFLSVAESTIRDCLYNRNPQISNLKRISITPEEAIREIKTLIQEEGVYERTTSIKIQAILNKVI